MRHDRGMSAPEELPADEAIPTLPTLGEDARGASPSGRERPARRMRSALAAAPGLLLALIIASVATLLARLAPVVGAAVFAIVLGIGVRQLLGMPRVMLPGVRIATKRVLQLSIVLLGTGLSLAQVWRTGSSSLVVMLGTLVVGLCVMLALGRLLNIERTLTRLISVGTSICGASAIGALAPAIEADQEAIAYAISTVFLFNIGGVLLFPLLGHVLGLSQHAFGLWAGTAINDTSSVVAAGYIYGAAAGTYAVIVKLTRTVMIIPVVLVFAVLYAREQRHAKDRPDRRGILHGFPLFIVWFLAASALNTLGAFRMLGPQTLPAVGQFLIVVALAGVGLSADLRAMVRTGARPIVLGLLGWLTLATTSLLLQHLVAGL